MTGIVLAGGISQRLGMDKAFLRLGGRLLIELVVAKLVGLFDDMMVVASNAEPFKFLGIRVVEDRFKDKGPLGGIHTGLEAAVDFHNFVVACDMPFINMDLVKYIVAEAADYDVVVPKIGERVHPLFGIYSKNCVKPMEGRLEAGDLKVTSFYPEVKVKFIDEKMVKAYDPAVLSLFNINSREDYEKAVELMAKVGI